jgi:hypothetical protein
VWRVLVEDPDVDALTSAIDGVAALPGVAAVRAVPGEPSGLGELWAHAEPTWHRAGARWLLRSRDGVWDRDRLPQVGGRPLEPTDLAVLDSLDRAIDAIDGASEAVFAGKARARPIRDTTGRPGLEVALVPGAMYRPNAVRALFLALGAVQGPVAIGHLGHRVDGDVVMLWFAGQGEPRWT